MCKTENSSASAKRQKYDSVLSFPKTKAVDILITLHMWHWMTDLRRRWEWLAPDRAGRAATDCGEAQARGSGGQD